MPLATSSFHQWFQAGIVKAFAKGVVELHAEPAVNRVELLLRQA